MGVCVPEFLKWEDSFKDFKFLVDFFVLISF